MNRSSRKTGLAAKYLAMLASITMILAGVAGVAFAGSASAESNEKVWICHADTNNGNGQIDLGVDGTGGELKNGFNLIHISPSAWENAHKALHPNDREATAAEIAQGYCGPPDTPVCDDDEDLVGDVCVPECKEDEIRAENGSCVNPCDVQIESVVYRDDVKQDPCDDPCDDTVNLSGPRTLNEDPKCPSDPSGDAWLNCDGDWTASVTIPGDDSVEVQVLIDGEFVAGEEDVEGSWSGSGSEAYLGDGDTHTIEVQIRHGEGGWKTLAEDTVECNPEPTVEATCDSLTVDLNGADPDWIWVTVDDEYLDESGSYDADADTLTFKLDGSVSKDVAVFYGETREPFWSKTVKACDAPPPDFCAENPTAPSCVPPATCANNPAACPPGDTPPVVAAATVEAPAPATVAAPAPATVAAPAPATVAVPAAATLPASVPAGEGSQAPGLPMWALALIALGALGAVAAGKGLLGARK